MHDSIEEPVFLVGATRSGTTLLTLMLDHHPAIAFPGEFEWVFEFPGLEGKDSLRGPELDEYRDWLSLKRHFRFHGLEADPMLPFPALVRSFLRQMKDAEGAHKPLVGAALHRHYARLLEAWPKARFIHVVRDGRDVCASWIRFGWRGNAYHGALAWTEALDEWEDLRSALPEDRWMELRLEDLIRDPRAKLAEVCRFMGTEFDPAMLEYSKNTTYGAPDPSKLARWKQELSERSVRVFEALAGDYLTRYGYERSGLPPLRIGPAMARRLDIEARVLQNRARMKSFGLGLWLADHVTRRVRVPWLAERVHLRMNEIINANLK